MCLFYFIIIPVLPTAKMQYLNYLVNTIIITSLELLRREKNRTTLYYYVLFYITIII
jgi:hypothetical protein